MSDLTSTTGIVAIAAAAASVVGLSVATGVAVRLRRFRSDQRAILGEENRDLVSHAAALEQSFHALEAHVSGTIASLAERVQAAEERLDGAIAYRALVRYDAYGEMSGRQSTSIALLDARRSGIVLSSISHREQARLYAKQIHEGKPELELSPEEAEAVRLALAGGAPAETRGGA